MISLLLGIAVSMAEAQTPRPAQRPHLQLVVLADTLAVCRLPADAPVPLWAAGPSRFLTVSRTSEELSITAVQASVLPELRTDYVLVKAGDLEPAIVAIIWRTSCWTCRTSSFEPPRLPSGCRRASSGRFSP